MRWKRQEKKSNPETCFCRVCFNPIEDDTLHSLLNSNKTICYKCFSKSNPILRKFKISNVNALSIYPYDEFIRSNLYQLKGCFDIELASIFLEYYASYLNIKYFGYVIVPAPSYIDADTLRGFNHVQEMFKTLKLEQYPCIKKTKNIKQSDLNFHERQSIKESLIFDEKFNIKDKKILLVDDVLTTGSTMKAMIQLIKNHHPKKIEVLVMSMVVNKDKH